MNDMNTRAAFIVEGSANNAAATATSPTPADTAIGRVYITLVVASYTGVVAAATTLVVGDGTTTFTIRIPAGVATVPNVPIVIPFTVPVPFKKGGVVTAVLGALGTGIIGNVQLAGYQGQ